jgi:Tol biopolymer transport system component
VYYQLQSVGLQKDVPYIMALDAHGKKQQIAIPTECTHTLVSWSKQKLFCYGDTRGYLIDPTTHTTKQVTMGQRFITSDHAWSADGNYIVVTTNYIVSSSQLQMLNLGTMQFETVTPTVFDGYIGRAVFSPDGTHIAFSVAKNQVNSKEEIMLYSFLTKRVTSLLENPVCPGDSDCSIRGMQFSHDSSTLYYATESFTTSTTKPYVDTLVLVHLSDLQQQKVVKANRDSILDSFSFSSYDGAQSLLYSTSPYGTNVHKLSIATNTETVLKLHDNVSLGSEPLLTPDGQWVLYTQQENATRVTYMEKLDTTKRYAIFTGNEKVIAVRNNTLGE